MAALELSTKKVEQGTLIVKVLDEVSQNPYKVRTLERRSYESY
jgi:hypothetical protein